MTNEEILGTVIPHVARVDLWDRGQVLSLMEMAAKRERAVCAEVAETALGSPEVVLQSKLIAARIRLRNNYKTAAECADVRGGK